MAIIYPDIETAIVSHLKNALGSNVYVATKKPAADAVQPSKIVVVNATFSGDKQVVTKYAGIILDVYADTDLLCTNLALLTEAHLRTLSGSGIKKVEILSGPSRQDEDTQQEKRSISAEVVVKATDL